jgi:hypothetical protein
MPDGYLIHPLILIRFLQLPGIYSIAKFNQIKSMTTLLRTLSLTVVLFLTHTLYATATDPYTRAWLKWDAGNYIGALEDFLGILDSPDADLYFDDIARLTGEIYKVDKLSDDGRNPVFSPDNSTLPGLKTGMVLPALLLPVWMDLLLNGCMKLKGMGWFSLLMAGTLFLAGQKLPIKWERFSSS